MMLSENRLRAVLSYDPTSGAFTWRESPNQRIRIGATAGTMHPKGYLYIRIDGRRYAAHRLAWLYVHGAWPQEQIDHINRVKSDNRISNLRDVPDSVNKLNMDRSALVRDGQGRFAAAA